MKVAIVADYIKEYGGAERVLEALHEIYPSAPIYTSIYLPSFLGPHKERFEKMDIRTSFAQHFPFKAKLISPLRLIAPFLFKSFDFSSYDVVVVSATGAYSPNIINKRNAVQFCYCHTPPRYLYGYATARNWKKNIFFRTLGEIANHFLRMVDFRASENVDFFIANSNTVKKRIEKFYRKEATVIYPPVDIDHKIKKDEKREYFLAGGRLARAKHIDLIVKAFLELSIPLKIFGKGFAGFDKELIDLVLKSGKENIEFLGEVNDEEKLLLMRGAKAYVFAGEDEDFGITPVEAMSVGTAVIAYRSGGVVESVIEGKTGIFFDELSVSSLVLAIEKFEKKSFIEKEILHQASLFSSKRFISQIAEFITKNYEKKNL